MATFNDLDEFFDGALKLPVRGKEYVIPPASAQLGLWCRRTAEAAGEIHAASTPDQMDAAIAAAQRAGNPPDSDKDLTEQLLGTAYQQMVADNIPDPYIQFCAQTAYIWITAGEELASRYWNSGGRPEAQGPGNRAQRRANTQKTSTAAATETRSPGSTSGTSSRRKSKRNGKGRGARGAQSLKTGR